MLTVGVGGPAFLILRYWPDCWWADSCLAGCSSPPRCWQWPCNTWNTLW